MTRKALLFCTLSVTCLASLALAACSPTEAVRPERTGAGLDSTDANRIVLTVSTVPGAGGFVERDTITIAAAVLSWRGTAVDSGDVTFEAEGPFTPTKRGSRTAQLELFYGPNVVNAYFRNRSGLLLKGSITIRTKPVPSTVVVWQSDGSITEIPQPDDVHFLSPRAINERGEVVGVAHFAAENRAFIWSESLGLRIIRSTEEDDSEGHDINDEGIVVGYRRIKTGIDGFLWTPQQGFVSLGGASGPTVAMGINGSAVVAGSRNYQAVRWTAQTGFEQLATTPGGKCSGASAIGAGGYVIGWVGTYFDDGWCLNWSPVLWDPDGAVHTIRECSTELDCATRVVDVNGAGEVIGNNGTHPFRWTKSGGFRDLLGDADGVALGINEQGEVAGAIEYPLSIPVVWDRFDRMHILPLPRGRKAGTAQAINNNGQVVGVVK